MAAGLLAAAGTVACAYAEDHSGAASRTAAADGCLSEDLAAKIGQTIMVGFPGQTDGDPGVRAIRTQLQEGTVGGVVLFPDNIRDKAQLTTLIAALRETRTDLPPFIAVDQEGGAVQRLRARKGFGWFPSAELVGKNPSLDSQEIAEAIYAEMAAELAELGFNMNLGPVVDVNTNPHNPVIGARGRSFGSDVDTVAEIAAAFINAHHAANIATVAKHFPGHGSSAVDSHRKLADISNTWQELELEPYRRLAMQGLLDAVMIGHLYHPRFSDLEDLPTSLSAKTIQALRADDGLAFDGVVVSDDLEMGAIRDAFSPEEAAVRAIKTGTDIVVFSNIERGDTEFGVRIHDALKAAVCDGRIGKARIEEAYGRIAGLKDKLKTKSLHRAW